MRTPDKERNIHIARVLAVIASPFVLIGGALRLFLSFSDGKLGPDDFFFPVFFFVVLAVFYFVISGKNPPSWTGFSRK
jgi:hypothetical protein